MFPDVDSLPNFLPGLRLLLVFELLLYLLGEFRQLFGNNAPCSGFETRSELSASWVFCCCFCSRQRATGFPNAVCVCVCLKTCVHHQRHSDYAFFLDIFPKNSTLQCPLDTQSYYIKYNLLFYLERYLHFRNTKHLKAATSWFSQSINIQIIFVWLIDRSVYKMSENSGNLQFLWIQVKVLVLLSLQS